MCNKHIIGLKAYFLGVAPIPLIMLLKDDRTTLELYNKLVFFLYVRKSKYELPVFTIFSGEGGDKGHLHQNQKVWVEREYNVLRKAKVEKKLCTSIYY